MRARPREPREGATTSIHPTDFQMWKCWSGVCMADGCELPLEVQVVTQLRWNSLYVIWGYCGGHASASLPFHVACKNYFLQVEAWGTWQGELDLDID